MSSPLLPENLYPITAKGHLDRAIYLLDKHVKENPLQYALYAALELRNAIERLLFEYLVLIHGAENVSKKMENIYTAKELHKRIDAVEPELEQKISFMNLFLRANGLPPAVVPDLTALTRLYGQLNNYLHAWKRPENTAQNPDYWKGFWSILDETQGMLTQILRMSMQHMRLEGKGLALYEAWKQDKLSDEEVIQAFRESRDSS